VAQLRIMVCGAVALAASVVLAGPASAIVGERHIVDGCEVGGGGNDIQSLQSRYDEDRNEIMVTLRLCSAATRNAIYRVHLDHAAPFVGEAEAAATCDTPADSTVARRPGGHQGVGTSEIRGNLVRFVVPLDDLDVGAPDEVPLIPLWATSNHGGTVDRAPNRETGDDCGHPGAPTETLVQTRAVFGLLAWIGSTPFEGLIDGVSDASGACTMEAHEAGLRGTFAAWFSARGLDPALLIEPSTGPFSTGDGTLVAQTVADLGDCTKGASGTDCLWAPINRDIHGYPVAPGTLTWTGTLPDGTDAGAPDCNGWTAFSADVSGNGGDVDELGQGWTTGSVGPCNQIRHLICLQLIGQG
jgi:hypothetical protein